MIFQSRMTTNVDAVGALTHIARGIHWYTIRERLLVGINARSMPGH